jgi:hypothetical protein
MNLLPQVTAIGNIQSRILAGKLNGQMHAHTPSGCQMLHVSMSLETFSKFSHLWNYHPTFLLCHFLQAWLNPKDYNHILIWTALGANQVNISIFSIQGSSQQKQEQCCDYWSPREELRFCLEGVTNRKLH